VDFRQAYRERGEVTHEISEPKDTLPKILLGLLETSAGTLPPEFWLHLGRGLQELGKALEILAEHGRVFAAPADEWLRLYETIMQREPRVGRAREGGEIGN